MSEKYLSLVEIPSYILTVEYFNTNTRYKIVYKGATVIVDDIKDEMLIRNEVIDIMNKLKLDTIKEFYK
jgi:hypothetical protein